MTDRWEDELSLACPHCARPAGQMCVYTTAVPGCGHELGQETRVPHSERRRVGKIIRERRAQQWRMERLADKALRSAPRPRRGSTRLMVLGFDPAERAALRKWLAVHGHILWEQ